MRKIIALILLFIMILSFTSCRKKDYVIITDNKASEDTRSTNTESPTKTPEKVNTINVTPTISATINYDNGMSAEMGSLKAVADNTKLEVVISGTDKEGKAVKDRIRVEKAADLITGIVELSWIDEKQLVIIGHINPDLECLLVYDLETKDFTTIKYGISFLWKDNDITTLIYILPKPHFSDSGNSVIMNYKDEVLYTEKDGVTIANLSWYGDDCVQFEQRIPQKDNEDKIVIKSIKIE